MNANADLIAEAIRTALDGGFAADPRSVSQDIDVQRVHTIDIKSLEKLTDWKHATPAAKAIKVYVRANPEVANDEASNRTRVWVDYPITIAIAAKPATIASVDIDPLKFLAQELRDWFYQSGREMPPGREECITGEPDVLIDGDSETLRQSRLFLSEFIITFGGWRSRHD